MTPEEIVNEILGLREGMTRPVYRGQSKGNWPLESSANRRLSGAYGKEFTDTENEQQLNLVDRYHCDHLVRPMEVIDGLSLSQLQRLSMLQHQGAATGLLDFTEYPLVALWFACVKGAENDYEAEDGKVFVLDIGDPQQATNARTNNKLMEDPFSSAHRSGSQIVYYEPDQSLGPRILAQKSVFVIGDPKISDRRFKSAIIPRQSKKVLRVYLEQLGLSQTTLFCDIPGLAKTNTAHTKLLITDPLSPEQYRNRGNREYQAGRFEDALAEYKLYAKALPAVAQPYCLQADALAALGRFEEANCVYSKAIENLDQPIFVAKQVILDPDIAKMMTRALYYNRGNVRAASGNHQGALKDYDEALQSGFQPSQSVRYNRGNSKFALGWFNEAHEDFEAVWRSQERSSSALAMGNCKVRLGEFEDALRRYLDGSEAQPKGSATHCRENLEQVRKILRELDGREHSVRNERSDVFVETEGATGHFLFVGNLGNTGNVPSGMVTAYGGKSYEGAARFAVVIKPPTP